MLFTTLAGASRDISNLAAHGITALHRNTDAALDNTGLSAFIPPALHETSDGLLGLAHRGVRDVGHTAADILESLDKRPLHPDDKSIGGNLKKGGKKGRKGDKGQDRTRDRKKKRRD
ncbi:hypothetical protein NP233_g9961 [Leucocoprinus birnbaumii]|uniref:Uncharacterized protein n=1 Tax=Leucocoprinus birnbaumii TaxID=56174 RepID=A0AAD5VN13_9AGAR|nr:hypothetical protein NP233_g9961 [Leucocoprinus birnbaumii]